MRIKLRSATAAVLGVVTALAIALAGSPAAAELVTGASASQAAHAAKKKAAHKKAAHKKKAHKKKAHKKKKVKKKKNGNPRQRQHRRRRAWLNLKRAGRRRLKAPLKFRSRRRSRRRN